jgi:hypothetical protein
MAFSSDPSPSPERASEALRKTTSTPSGEALPETTLEQVIQQTADELGQVGPADPELWQALRDAARQLPAGPLTLEPVAVTLVQTVLMRQLEVLAQRQALLAHAARVVAEAILADLTSRERLAALWQRLQEGAP